MNSSADQDNQEADWSFALGQSVLLATHWLHVAEDAPHDDMHVSGSHVSYFLFLANSSVNASDVEQRYGLHTEQ